jgi:hypothetical protein
LVGIVADQPGCDRRECCATAVVDGDGLVTTIDELTTFAASGFFLFVGHDFADHITGQCVGWPEWDACR